MNFLVMQSDLATGQAPGAQAFFGYMGITFAMIFSNLGAAYGTAKSGVGISSMGVLKPEKIVKGIIPVVMAGILGIYGLVVSVLLITKINFNSPYTYYTGYAHFCSGLCCGLSALVRIYYINIL